MFHGCLLFPTERKTLKYFSSVKSWKQRQNAKQSVMTNKVSEIWELDSLLQPDSYFHHHYKILFRKLKLTRCNFWKCFTRLWMNFCFVLCQCPGPVYHSRWIARLFVWEGWGLVLVSKIILIRGIIVLFFSLYPDNRVGNLACVSVTGLF